MNLAPWKYRNIRSDQGGPIEKLLVQPVVLSSRMPAFEALAKLDVRLLPDRERVGKEPVSIYGHFEGAGTSKYRSIACYKAISEALERWALKSLRGQESGNAYGFDIDPYSNGMAAFPGLTRANARHIAFREGIERWSIIAWWNGEIGAREVQLPIPDVQVFHLQTVVPNVETVVLFAHSPAHRAGCYAFGGGATFSAAVEKALVELERNQRALDHYYGKTGLTPDNAWHAIDELSDIFERRLLYFSSKRGIVDFFDKVQRDANRVSPGLPRLIVDSEILGPWSRYATIWRCLFQFPSREYLTNREDYFFF
ncbi:hypothetical protein WDW37_10235 [Bdellovibrionota bacterium FG-1]